MGCTAGRYYLLHVVVRGPESFRGQVNFSLRRTFAFTYSGFLRLLIGDLGTPKLAQIFAYGKWLYPYIMLLHGASDLDQRCLKMRNSEDECTFPPNIFAPTPKPRFGGPFNAKPIKQTALRQSHVNGATTLKLYGYIGIGKNLGLLQNFSASLLGDVCGTQGPLM